MTRVGQAVRQRAVVRQEQEALRVHVEAADGMHASSEIGQQVEDPRPVPWVVPGRQVARGLVEQDVALRLRISERPPVHLDTIALRIGVSATINGRRSTN